MEDQDVELTDSLYHVSFVLQARLERVAAAHDLSLTQVRLLGILRDREPTMVQLARHLHLGKSSLSGLIDRAEARGLVERMAAENDRRATHVRMTKRGSKLAHKVARQLTEQMQELTRSLSAPQKAALVGCIAVITAQDNHLGAAS